MTSSRQISDCVKFSYERRIRVACFFTRSQLSRIHSMETTDELRWTQIKQRESCLRAPGWTVTILLQNLPQATVALEAGTHGPWISRIRTAR